MDMSDLMTIIDPNFESMTTTTTDEDEQSEEHTDANWKSNVNQTDWTSHAAAPTVSARRDAARRRRQPPLSTEPADARRRRRHVLLARRCVVGGVRRHRSLADRCARAHHARRRCTRRRRCHRSHTTMHLIDSCLLRWCRLFYAVLLSVVETKTMWNNTTIKYKIISTYNSRRQTKHSAQASCEWRDPMQWWGRCVCSLTRRRHRRSWVYATNVDVCEVRCRRTLWPPMRLWTDLMSCSCVLMAILQYKWINVKFRVFINFWIFFFFF